MAEATARESAPNTGAPTVRSIGEESHGALAKFLFDRTMIERFREAFPRARWQDEARAWFVPGRTAERRLERWFGRELASALGHADARGRDAFAFDGLDSAYLGRRRPEDQDAVLAGRGGRAQNRALGLVGSGAEGLEGAVPVLGGAASPLAGDRDGRPAGGASRAAGPKPGACRHAAGSYGAGAGARAPPPSSSRQPQRPTAARPRADDEPRRRHPHRDRGRGRRRGGRGSLLLRHLGRRGAARLGKLAQADLCRACAGLALAHPGHPHRDASGLVGADARRAADRAP